MFQVENDTPVTYYNLKETLEKLCILFNPRYDTPHCLHTDCTTNMHLLGYALPEI